MALARRSPLLAVLVLTLIMVATLIHVTSVAAGNERVCSDETISSGTFSKVVIEAGTSCTLEGSVVVEGDVEANGAVNVTISGIRIDGNVTVKESSGTLILILNSEILGNVDLNENTINPGPGDIAVVGNTIGGNVETKDNFVADGISIGVCSPSFGRGNIIDGNVTIKKNSIDDIQVACNEIGGNVDIKTNTAGTDVRAPGNTVAGNFIVMDTSATRRFVLGSFTATNGRELPGNTVLGNIVVKGNTNTLARIVVGSDPNLDDGNTVLGNLTVKNNTAQDEIFVKANSVDGNLSCKGNNPDPTVGDNTVGGNLNCAD